MKFTITAKNPDSIEDSIRRAAEESIDDENLMAVERDAKIYNKMEELWESCAKWVEYQEYIRIEIDTEKGTATVLEV